jgi:hypothetical protein
VEIYLVCHNSLPGALAPFLFKTMNTKDFLFNSFSRGSIPYEKEEILNNLKNDVKSEEINVLGFLDFEALLYQLEKKKPNDIVGNHLFDKPNAVVVNENGNIVVKLIDKNTNKIRDDIFYKFKNIIKAAEILYSIKEKNRYLKLLTLAQLEDQGKKTELSEYADPLVVKNTLEKLKISVPKSIQIK